MLTTLMIFEGNAPAFAIGGRIIKHVCKTGAMGSFPSMDTKLLARVLFALAMLALLHWAGVPLQALLVLGLLFLFFLLMRGHAYERIDAALAGKLPFIAEWAPWQRRALAAIVFVVVLIAVKQGIYEILKLVGMDVQKMVLDGINASMKG